MPMSRVITASEAAASPPMTTTSDTPSRVSSAAVRVSSEVVGVYNSGASSTAWAASSAGWRPLRSGGPRRLAGRSRPLPLPPRPRAPPSIDRSPTRSSLASTKVDDRRTLKVHSPHDPPNNTPHVDPCGHRGHCQQHQQGGLGGSCYEHPRAGAPRLEQPAGGGPASAGVPTDRFAQSGWSCVPRDPWETLDQRFMKRTVSPWVKQLSLWIMSLPSLSSAPSRAQLVVAAEATMREVLPPGWTLQVERGDRGPDLLLTMTTQEGQSVRFVAEVKREASGQQLLTGLEDLRRHVADAPGSRPLFIAPWIGERSRVRLAAAGVAWLDATGNAHLTADRPGLWVTAVGGSKNPWPTGKALQSLRGAGAARAVRALLDLAPPTGVRALAARTNASAATLSRVIDLLERDGLAVRDDRGGVGELDWAGTIRRWAQDYDVLRTNETGRYLQPRGLPALTAALGTTSIRYAVTGSVAANLLAPVAPARVAMVYVEDLAGAAAALALRPVETGVNVMLLEPFDGVVFARTIERDDLILANPTQLAVDLLTGPGRAPSEGEALLAWMEANVDAWRS